MTTLLILTAGQTDVQLVQGNTRLEFDRGTCGELHDQIAQRSWKLVDAPQNKGEKCATELPDGDLELSTPKLDAVLNWCNDTVPTAALIVETRRTFRSDPRYAGIVLVRRLQERGVTNVVRHTMLKGEEWLEDRNTPLDAVVRHKIVDRVAGAIENAFSDINPDNVVVAATGGLAAANLVIDELVRLHAVGCAEVQVLEIPDSALVGGKDRAVPEKLHPATGFRARWQALSLIESGNLLGAWGAAVHLADKPGQQWVQVVDWLRCFASSLPMPDDCEIAVLRHHRMAVRAALRVEVALRAGDIPRAVHGTVAFFEAALWDGLNERVERSKDPQRDRYFKIQGGDPQIGDKLRRRGDNSGEDRKRPFEHKDTIDGVDWYWIYDGDGGPAGRLAQYFLKRGHLKSFDGVLSGNSIRNLRNDVAHNEPTPELMDNARAKMRKACLWSDSDTFLSQALVQNVLRELSVDRPETLCGDLIQTVRDRLVNHRCKAPEFLDTDLHKIQAATAMAVSSLRTCCGVR